MLPGDYLISISGIDVKWESHESVVTLIKAGGDSLKVKLVTPLDKFGKYGTVRTVGGEGEYGRTVMQSDVRNRRTRIGDLFST